MDKNLYELSLSDTQKVKIFNLLVQSPDLSDLVYWHRILRHVNFEDIIKLKDKWKLRNVDIQGIKCEECILAKVPQLSFKSNSFVLNAIHNTFNTDQRDTLPEKTVL